jgi:hypothetical protein
MIKSKTIEKRIEKSSLIYSELRTHLGASIIGHDCSRYIWYNFRWAKRYKIEARQARILNFGKLAEKIILRDLINAGYKVYIHPEDRKNQFRVVDCYGHFGGSLDGLLTTEEDIYVIECKTSKDAYFNQLKKHGLKAYNRQHWVQGNIYAYLFGADGFVYISYNKNTSEYYIKRYKTNKKIAEYYIDRAFDIIYTQEAPMKINLDPTFYKCRMCPYCEVCHEEKAPRKSCRTCEFSRPMKIMDGREKFIQSNSLHMGKYESTGTWNCIKEIGENKMGIPQYRKYGEVCDGYSRLF